MAAGLHRGGCGSGGRRRRRPGNSSKPISLPFLAGNNGEHDGLFTGYFEITLNGSRKRGGPYQTPLYRRPPEPNRHTRAEIEDGALAGKGLELVWVDDPVDAFFLEIQGSGRVNLPDGTIMRVGYDGQNGKPYVPVGRLLIERGELPRDKVTMAAIRRWMGENPKKGAALRRENPSYVFFREISGEGPIGAQQVPLIAGRSLAVDRAFIPLGMPIWIDVQQRFAPHDTIRRLVVAQDTGGAIKGPVRGDLFWGHGKEAASGAGAMNARGRYYLLLPKSRGGPARAGVLIRTEWRIDKAGRQSLCCRSANEVCENARYGARRAAGDLPGRSVPAQRRFRGGTSCWRRPAARWRCRARRPAAASRPIIRATAPTRRRSRAGSSTLLPVTSTSSRHRAPAPAWSRCITPRCSPTSRRCARAPRNWPPGPTNSSRSWSMCAA